jgi:hypothetical protein
MGIDRLLLVKVSHIEFQKNLFSGSGADRIVDRLADMTDT